MTSQYGARTLFQKREFKDVLRISGETFILKQTNEVMIVCLASPIQSLKKPTASIRKGTHYNTHNIVSKRGLEHFSEFVDYPR